MMDYEGREEDRRRMVHYSIPSPFSKSHTFIIRECVPISSIRAVPQS